ncbi:hypothetical protein ACFL1M_00720 [Patescibacteria group bacterium]
MFIKLLNPIPDSSRRILEKNIGETEVDEKNPPKTKMKNTFNKVWEVINKRGKNVYTPKNIIIKKYLPLFVARKNISIRITDKFN